MPETATQRNQNPFADAPIIYSYTRAQAIEDGVLVDVSESDAARELGFRFPIAMTRTVWDRYVTPDPRAEKLGQSVMGRLWDTLWMLHVEIKRSGGREPVIYYKVYFIQKARQKRLITLKAVVGPGDHGEPIITIMLPEED